MLEFTIDQELLTDNISNTDSFDEPDIYSNNWKSKPATI